MIASPAAGDCFQRAPWYPTFCPPAATPVRESASPQSSWAWTERHLQAVWFDPAYRPARLRTHTGEAVRVEHPGHWNLEEGPDFIGAALRIGPAHRRVTGDIELHVHPADWIRHGHRDDDRYRNVIAHVTYYPGALDAQRLRPTIAQIALKEALAGQPDFSFEAVDIGAYPYAVRGTDVPCRRWLDGMDAGRIHAVLQIAGEARLHRKTDRLMALIDAQGAEQALYEEWMAALGYRRNDRPFRRLARAAPLTVLREESGGDALRAYAFLLGIAGLLPYRLPDEWGATAHRFFRTAWDSWWKQRDRWHAQILPADAWHLSGLRPVNHPLRRLMAAAAFFSHPDGVAERLHAPVPGTEKAWIREQIESFMIRDPSGFWDHHPHLAAHRTPGAIRLVGRGRAAAILVNVLIPWMTAMGRLRAPCRALLEALPAEDESGAVRRAAHIFLGTGTLPALPGGVLCRQGLLQLFSDFCLPDRSGCRTCRLPGLLETAVGRHF